MRLLLNTEFLDTFIYFFKYTGNTHNIFSIFNGASGAFNSQDLHLGKH